MGGLSPILTFFLVYIFSLGREALSLSGTISFILLTIGSVLIVFRKEEKITWQSLKVSFLAAFFFSFSFVTSKYVYNVQPFWNGFIWMRIGGFLASVFLLFSPEVRKELLKKIKPKRNSIGKRFDKKTFILFFSSQILGAGSSILQNVAISIAPLAYVSIISALQGIQYVFLFLFSVFLSVKIPSIIKEEISMGIIIQKSIAILFICLGLMILAF